MPSLVPKLRIAGKNQTFEIPESIVVGRLWIFAKSITYPEVVCINPLLLHFIKKQGSRTTVYPCAIAPFFPSKNGMHQFLFVFVKY